MVDDPDDPVGYVLDFEVRSKQVMAAKATQISYSHLAEPRHFERRASSNVAEEALQAAEQVVRNRRSNSSPPVGRFGRQVANT